MNIKYGLGVDEDGTGNNTMDKLKKTRCSKCGCKRKNLVMINATDKKRRRRSGRHGMMSMMVKGKGCH